MMKNILWIVVVISILISCAGPKTADLVLRGGKIATVDEAFSIHEAVAVRGDQIVFVGSDKDIENFIGPETRIIELEGRLVTPGMVDAHGHPFNLGNTDEEDWFSVGGTKNWDEVVKLVAAKVKTIAPGEWIIGGGWYEPDWPDPTVPNHDGLSRVSPKNPVYLYRRGGNSCFVNAKALEIAGINKDTQDPYGGMIDRKPNGEPSGFLVNMANNMVHKHFPKPDKPLSWYTDNYKNAAKQCNEVGLTGWHDAGLDPIYLDAYKDMVDKGELNVRVNAMLQNPREGDLEAYFSKHRVLNYGGRHMFQVRSVKMFFDGGLGSRGAAVFQPYEDDPDNIGIYEVPPEHVYEVSVAALKTGMQVCPHAIGPRANWEILNQFEKSIKEVGVKDHRFRSEHAEVIRPQEVARFADLGVIPSVQPIHHTSDMEFLVDRLGEERCKAMASPWRSFIDAGCVLPCGSDHAIYSHNPMTGIYAAVTRKWEDGTPEDGYYSKQAMTREEAIRGYTIWPAYSAFLEDVVGSIEKGKYADITVWDKDVLTIEPADILKTKPEYTIVAGRIVYER